MSDRPDTLDATDRRIVAALQADPRASWSQLGAIVDVSETTVMRRVQRLREGGRLLVIAVPDSLRCGFGQPVFVYFQTVPGAAPALAQQLAERSDVRYVSLLAGAWDIMCELIVPNQRYLQRVVMTELPDRGLLQRTSTALVLKRFKTRDQWSGAVLDSTSDWGESSTVVPREPITALDAVDERIVAELRVDGRRSFADLGAALGLSETTVARRISALTADQRLSFLAMVDPVALGFDLEAIINFRVEPSAVEAAASRLVGMPPIRYLAATTGTSHLTCDAVFSDTDNLYAFLNDAIAGIRGIADVQVDVILEAVKREYHYPLFVPPARGEVQPAPDGPPGTAAAPPPPARRNGRRPAERTRPARRSAR